MKTSHLFPSGMMTYRSSRTLAESHRSAGPLHHDEESGREAEKSHPTATRSRPGIISAMLHPSLSRQCALTESIALISHTPLTFEKIRESECRLRSLCKDPKFRDTAELWLAICKRLKGLDARKEFEELLRKRPGHRLSLVNLAANHLTSPHLDLSSAEQTTDALAKHLERHPDDKFGRLLLALLTFTFRYDEDSALKILENLYLDYKKYTPALSTMAAILSRGGGQESGIDFAEEAVRIDQNNWQTLSIIDSGFSLDMLTDKKKNPLLHVQFSGQPAEPRALLYGAYHFQDPAVTTNDFNSFWMEANR